MEVWFVMFYIINVFHKYIIIDLVLILSFLTTGGCIPQG
jgi:hypothetical protein